MIFEKKVFYQVVPHLAHVEMKMSPSWIHLCRCSGLYNALERYAFFHSRKPFIHSFISKREKSSNKDTSDDLAFTHLGVRLRAGGIRGSRPWGCGGLGGGTARAARAPPRGTPERRPACEAFWLGPFGESVRLKQQQRFNYYCKGLCCCSKF